MLSSIPLFPLADVVLFPHAVLPLHIFEPRYRSMMADALASDRQIAMALLSPGEMDDGLPRIEPVVCVGKIESHNRLPDGRYQLLLQGIRRAIVVRETQSHPYRAADLMAMDELPADESKMRPDRGRLEKSMRLSPFAGHQVCAKFAELLTEPVKDVRTPDMADLIAFNLLSETDEKQQLLGDVDPAHRVHVVAAILDRMTGHDTRGSTVASLN